MLIALLSLTASSPALVQHTYGSAYVEVGVPLPASVQPGSTLIINCWTDSTALTAFDSRDASIAPLTPLVGPLAIFRVQMFGTQIPDGGPQTIRVRTANSNQVACFVSEFSGVATPLTKLDSTEELSDGGSIAATRALNVPIDTLLVGFVVPVPGQVNSIRAPSYEINNVLGDATAMLVATASGPQVLSANVTSQAMMLWVALQSASFDAGTDAGPSLDAGQTGDAGVSPDAGATNDAGATSDAGATNDAGPTTDAGGLFGLDGGMSPADGGSLEQRTYTVGCGCAATPPFQLLALLLLARFATRRARRSVGS